MGKRTAPIGGGDKFYDLARILIGYKKCMSSPLEKEVEVLSSEENEVGAHQRSDAFETNASSESRAAIQLVMAADEDFAMPMAVTLFSLLSHLSSTQELQITALDAGISTGSKERLSQVVQGVHQKAEVEWIHPDVSTIESVDVEMDSRFSPAIFYRLLIPEVLPETCDRVLYVDSDIVFERSILPLWKKSFGENAILAVPERIVSCPKAGIAEWRKLGLDAGAPFFNSGLMLINLEAWREQDIHGQAINYLLDPENDFCYASDQEALNAVLAGHWGALDQRWNVIHQMYDPEMRTRHEEMLGTTLGSLQHNPYAIHFTSEKKPWLPRCSHPARDRFYHYLQESGWFSDREYMQWRSTLSARSVAQWAKDVSRPYRHMVGLRAS